jgi:CRP-like cAMP-binding protein
MPPISDDSKGYHSVLPSDTVNILSSPTWLRTAADAQEACQALQLCKSFCDYPPHIQKILCHIGWYQWLEKGRVILKEGHPASGFYFLLSGSVGIYQKRDGGEPELINTVEEGQSFGEFALMNDTKRTTTCIAAGVVELFAIGKSDYIDLSLRQVKLSYQRAMYLEFCRKIAVLRVFPLQYLQEQPDICKLTYYKPGSVIVKDSSKSDWIFIVINGSCQVLKKFVKTVASSQDKQYNLQRTANIYSQGVVKQLPGHVKAERTRPKVSCKYSFYSILKCTNTVVQWDHLNTKPKKMKTNVLCIRIFTISDCL